jgi:hypothetical protein
VPPKHLDMIETCAWPTFPYPEGYISLQYLANHKTFVF